MRIFSQIGRISFVATLALVAMISRAELRPGVEYNYISKPVPSENPGKIEVVEFFWYHCIHCFETQPLINAWRGKMPKDVAFRPIHVMWPGRESDMQGHAKIYLSLKNIGALDKLHEKVFDAIFTKNLELRDEDVLAKWVGQQGVSSDKFMAAYRSFGIATQVAQLQKLTTDSNIEGTPTFIVGGKYKVMLQEGHPMSEVFTTIDQLIDKVRKEQGSKKK